MDPALALEMAALSRQKAMNEAVTAGNSDIQRFYYYSTIFLTGGTGFLGKQLIEKLLRTCELKKLYILLRPKKGKNLKQRLAEMLLDPVFDTLKQQKPDFALRLECVEGDVANVRLGIDEDSWIKITKEVNIIYHIAATTRFDENIKMATLINVRGTRETILLGLACENLKSFVYVSTAYSHATFDNIGKEVSEKFHICPISPETLISMAENVNSDRLNYMTKGLIHNWPNTYTFTKAVAEEVVRTRSAGMPACIVRPSIVVGSYYEPSPGWLDMSTVYGVSGIIVSTGLGVAHIELTNPHIKVGLIPCDFVNNAVIAAGRQTAVTPTKGGEDAVIYTVSNTARNPITMIEMTRILNRDAIKIPTPKSVYYAYCLHTKYRTLYIIVSWFLHVIPAYIVDFICLLLQKERRFVKLSKKMLKIGLAFSHFSLHDWIFKDSNLDRLYQNMSETDKLIYNFDVKCIDWKEYVLLWCVGIRKYILKDGLKNTDYAVKLQFWLRIVHYVWTAIYIYLIWKCISAVWSVIM